MKQVSKSRSRNAGILLLTLTMFAGAIDCTAASSQNSGYQNDLDMFVSSGAMTEQSLDRINVIGQSDWADRKISDSDLSWALQLLKHGPIKPTDNAHELLTTKVMSSILLCRHFTRSQTAIIERTAAAMAESPHWDDRLWSVNMFMHTYDLAATPILDRLAQDPNGSVAATAKPELQKLQR